LRVEVGWEDGGIGLSTYPPFEFQNGIRDDGRRVATSSSGRDECYCVGGSYRGKGSAVFVYPLHPAETFLDVDHESEGFDDARYIYPMSTEWTELYFYDSLSVDRVVRSIPINEVNIIPCPRAAKSWESACHCRIDRRISTYCTHTALGANAMVVSENTDLCMLLFITFMSKQRILIPRLYMHAYRE